jgi:hypothetical protein
MKVGDLIEYANVGFAGVTSSNNSGIIIETGVYTGNKDVKVMWNNGKIITCKSEHLRLIK